MSALTDERLAEIEARAQAATPGPWEALPGSFQGKANVLTASPGDWTREPLVVSHMHYANEAKDFDFIAHAREDVTALVAEVRRLQAEVEEARWLLGAAPSRPSSSCLGGF